MTQSNREGMTIGYYPNPLVPDNRKRGYGEWLILNIFGGIAILLLVGPFTLGCYLVIRWWRPYIFNNPIWLAFALGWGLVCIWVSYTYGLYFERLELVWILTPPCFVGVGKIMTLFNKFSKWLKPKTLGEQIDDFKQKREQYEQQVARRVQQVGILSAETKKLKMGKFMKGDSFVQPVAGIQQVSGWLTMSEKVLDQHLFVLGTTGAGKSETLKRLIYEVLINTNRDIFFVDGKGDEVLAREVRGLAAQYGRGMLPVFKLGHVQRGAIYDGLRGQPEDIYNRLCALIGLEEMEGAATYYADINRDLLQLICYASEGPPRNFESLAQRLHKDWLKQAYQGNEIEQEVIERYSERDLEGLAVRLRPLIREFSPSVGEQGFALEETRGAIFSLRTQSVGDTAKRFLGFLVEDFKDFIGKRQKRPALLIIDEYAQFPSDSVLALLSLARSSRLGVILATQDVSTLGERGQRQQVLANTGTQILMKSNFPEDIGKLAGTTYQLESSMQHNEGVSTGLGSARIQHVFKVDMNEVSKLQPGEAFLIRNRYACKLQVEQVQNISLAPEQMVQKRQIQTKSVQQNNENQRLLSVKRKRPVGLEDL